MVYAFLIHSVSMMMHVVNDVRAIELIDSYSRTKYVFWRYLPQIIFKNVARKSTSLSVLYLDRRIMYV